MEPKPGSRTINGCVVANTKQANGTLSFDRTDNCLPFPVPAEAFTVLPMYPPIYELSQYTVRGKWESI